MEFGNTIVIKKTRKDHNCVCCGIKIPRGSNCHYTAGKFGGDFCAYYTCLACEQWVEAHKKELDNPFYWEDVAEMMLEEARDKCRSQCNHWDKDAEECEFEPNLPLENLRCDQFTNGNRNENNG
jgi:hypothetical protein